MAAHVLIVDDEQDLPYLIADFLEDVTEFQVSVAKSGEDGLEFCVTLQPDICIVDMRLPGMTGNEFILAVHEKIEKCKFIIHTGSIDYAIPDDLQNIGITRESILFKPVLSLANFAEKINLLLNS